LEAGDALGSGFSPSEHACIDKMARNPRRSAAGSRGCSRTAEGSSSGEFMTLSRCSARRPTRWVAIDDNTVGYDILSHALHDGSEVNRLIEVKTTQANPPRMSISRNEWNTAEQFGSVFEFHLWTLPACDLTILSVDDVRAHIPADIGKGKWESVEIRPL